MKWPSRNAPVRVRICITASWEGISSTMRFSCLGWAFSVRSIHQLLRFRSTLDITSLVARQTFRYGVNREPLRTFHFHVQRFDVSIRATAKQHFHLLWFLERTRREHFHVVNFQSDFLAQLTPQRLNRLFTVFHETAGQTPTAARAKTVFQKQHLVVVVEDNRTGGNGETRVRESHRPATDSYRQFSPDPADEILKVGHRQTLITR